MREPERPPPASIDQSQQAGGVNLGAFHQIAQVRFSHQIVLPPWGVVAQGRRALVHVGGVRAAVSAGGCTRRDTERAATALAPSWVRGGLLTPRREGAEIALTLCASAPLRQSERAVEGSTCLTPLGVAAFKAARYLSHAPQRWGRR